MKIYVSAMAAMFVLVLPARAEPTAETFKPTGSEPFDQTVRRFIEKLSPKIIGGVRAKSGDYPWQASLVVADIQNPASGHFCGASVYSNKWLVTAAHCMKGLLPNQFNVIVGANTLSSDAKRNSVSRIIIHADWGKKLAHDSDIALIELENPLSLGSLVQAIPLLPPADEDKTLVSGADLIVTGWGATMEGGGAVTDLRQVTIPYVGRDRCTDPLALGKAVSDNMICAGESGKDPCQGDSGGPLVTESNPHLVGIVSWGAECAQPRKFGVYTRVSVFKSWVEDCVAGKVCDAK
jgi:secreted trypsin-like serine protease